MIWLHGEPGSGRSMLARQAQRMVDELPGARRPTLHLLPEVMAPDHAMRERLQQTAKERACVFVVPVRTPLDDLSHGEHVITVDRLDRDAFDAVLWQLLQERPAPELAALVWSASGGLAGQARRIVEHMVRDGELVWTPRGMDVAVRGKVRAGRRGPRINPVSKINAVCAPLLMDLASWAHYGESVARGVAAV